MLSLLLKYRRGCLLALCALLGLAGGNLAATLLGMQLSRNHAPPASGRKAVWPTPAGDPATDLAYILQHHLFDPLARTSNAPVFSLRQGADAGGATTRTDFVLVGTVVAGARSLAVLRAGPETKSYRAGASLPGGGTVEEVVRHRVTIRNADHSLTALTMHEGERTATASSAPPRGEAGGAGQVRAAGDNRWVIPRSAAEAVRDNLGEQLRLAQMQPRIVNGRTEGFVIQKLSPGTLLAQMGMRRGDVIVRVNAMPIDSPEKALQILQQLREARQLNVDLERDGKLVSFAYAIE